MQQKNYTDVFSIKELYHKTIAPKYFPTEEINTLNVGLYGQVNEVMASTTEDVYNTIATYINELIPAQATMPASIHGYATTVQLAQLFATPAHVTAVLYINRDSIINEKTRQAGFYKFNLDRNMEVFVEEKMFLLDYDIEVIARPYKDRYIYNTRYMLNHQNRISNIRNPYIKCTEIAYEGGKYLAMVVTLHQATRHWEEENIINNTILNMPILSFDFGENKQLAGFNVYHQAPEKNERTQLKLRLANTAPVKEPFCYYRFKNDHVIELSFSTRDFYFRPELNSTIFIEYFTTDGEEGVFEKYTGNQIACIPKSEIWDYNNNLLVFCTIESASQFGTSMPTLEMIKRLYLERMTTVNSYTSDEDLNLHFENFTSMNHSITRFIKTRDDFQRIYSGYTILKNQHKDLYPTNTLNVELTPEEFDNSELRYTHILKPGKIFTYKGKSIHEVTKQASLTMKDDLTSLKDTEEFIYTNPFLMIVTKKPGSVGYYLNSIDRTILMDYSYINSDSIAQFICNGIHVFRDAYNGSDDYTIRIQLKPSMDLDEEIVSTGGLDQGILKPKIIFTNEGGEKICYENFRLVDSTNAIYTFETKITTDDVMTLSQKFRVKNIINFSSGEREDRLLPMIDSPVLVAIFFKKKEGNIPHSFPTITDVRDFTLTNIYSTVDEHVNWITPIRNMSSHFSFMPSPKGEPHYNVWIRHIPMVAASVLKDPKISKDFLYRIDTQIRFTNEALTKITNNYSVDLKFYNSYGRARNFIVDDNKEEQLLDKINLHIHFHVHPTVGAPVQDLLRDMRIHIREFVDTTNSGIFTDFHISNLIRSLENTFPDIKYLKFQSINGYDTEAQTIKSKHREMEKMPKEDKMDFIPEYLSVELDQIELTLI